MLANIIGDDMKFEWEVLQKGDIATICRAKVHGGWIFNTLTESPTKQLAETSVFIPDPNHEWKIE